LRLEEQRRTNPDGGSRFAPLGGVRPQSGDRAPPLARVVQDASRTGARGLQSRESGVSSAAAVARSGESARCAFEASRGSTKRRPRAVGRSRVRRGPATESVLARVGAKRIVFQFDQHIDSDTRDGPRVSRQPEDKKRRSQGHCPEMKLGVLVPKQAIGGGGEWERVVRSAEPHLPLYLSGVFGFRLGHLISASGWRV